MKTEVAVDYSKFGEWSAYEEHFADRMRIIRDPASSLDDVRKNVFEYKYCPPQFERNWRDDERFQKKVVIALYDERISEDLARAKTSDECLRIYSAIPRNGHLREAAVLKAISLATCKKALEIYRLVHYGRAARCALERAAKLAKTKNEWWQVAVHSYTCGNTLVWKLAVLALAKKMK